MSILQHYFHHISITPLLPITLAFTLGIILQATALPISIVIITSLPLAIIYTIYNYTQPFYKIPQVIAYCLITLFGAYLYNKNITEYHTLYEFTLNHPINITGEIIDIDKHINGHIHSTALTINVHSLQKKTEVKNIAKKIIIYTTQKCTDIQVGDIATFFTLQFKKPENESINYYNIKEHIAASIFENKLCYSVKLRPTWSFKRWLFNQKHKILSQMNQKLSSPCFVLFASLFLGNRACVKDKIETINEQFKQWGTYHLLSRSGIHLALFIFTWSIVFKLIPLPFLLKELILLLLILLYCALSWTSTPLIRSLALFFANKACGIIKLPYHSMHYLTLIFLCFLIYSPLHLFFIDFQLTFALTFALIWISQVNAQSLYQIDYLKTSKY